MFNRVPRVAEGYTALIPKEGPPGPLNTPPPTVFSMVYRLWAGITLREAIRWQCAWAHSCAFGFRPARSAPDGATTTQVLLELCRLKGWAVAGMSIDYVKCFDLIPQAVILALAWELAWTQGSQGPWAPCASNSTGRSRWPGAWGRGGGAPTESCRALPSP